MTKTSKIFGFVGLGGAVLLMAGVIAAMASFKQGVYSPLSCFITELGKYTGGYLSATSALFFNIGIVVFGLAFGLYMVWRGNLFGSTMYAAIGFLGALTGVLAAAQGIFTLNYSQYHYIVVSAFYFAAAAFCALQIVEWLRSGRSERFGLALLILAFATGALCLASAIFTVTGGMSRLFIEDISGVGRLLFVPFAVIGWLAIAALWAFSILLSLGAVLSPAQGVNAQKSVKRYNDFSL
jgi:hypothetical protein